MGDLFDGIDLEDLANSETPMVEVTNNAAPDDNTNTPTPAEGGTDEPGAQVDPNALDLDALAELEVIAEISDVNKEENEGGNGEQASQTPADNSDGSSPSSQEKFTSFASALSEAGVFSSLEQEELENIKDETALMDAIAKQIKSNEHANLNDDQKEYLEALSAGVTAADYATRKGNAEQYKAVTDDSIQGSEQIQYELIRRSFLLKGFDEKNSDKYAQMAVKAGSGVEDGIQARKVLVAHEESQIQDKIKQATEAKAQEEKDAANLLATLKSNIEESSEILPGIKITTPTKDKIFNSLTTPVNMKGSNPRNEVMDKYENDQDYKLKLHALHVLTKGFTDFSKFDRDKKSKAAQSFAETIKSGGAERSGSAKPGGVGNHIATGQTSSDIAEALKNISFK